jgi:tetratricopeptide (TPR) repeat protein
VRCPSCAGFFVIARNSSFTYKGKSVHLKQIGEELGVGYVVEGSVRKDGDRVRITAQLSDVFTGRHVWAERYDRNLADVFAVQDEITEAIVAAIEPQLYAAENFRAQRKPPDSMDAWDLVMRAMSHWWRITRQDSLVAQALLEAQYPWAHYALGFSYLFMRRFDDSLAEFEAALRLNPSFSLAHGHYGLALECCGRIEEAELATARALRLSPHGSNFSGLLGLFTHYLKRNYKESMRLSREAIRQRADYVGAYRVLTAAAAMAGEIETAKAVLQELRRLQPNISLEWVAKEIPIKGDAEREHYLEGFRRAGLE